MKQPLGLTTYRWNNNIKSILVLMAFPLLLLGMLWSFFFLQGYLGLGLYTFPENSTVMDYLHYANDQMGDYYYYPVAIACVWILVAYWWRSGLVLDTAMALPLSRKEEPDIYNLLENLCISRGLPMPKLYVIEMPYRNAFATGLDIKDSSITLTRGLIKALTLPELETVLAHELTHIINNDTRLLLVVTVFTGMLSFFSERLWRSITHMSGRMSGRKSSAHIGLILLAGVILLIGVFISTILRLALSRRREYMADAGALELTKNSEALIAALTKIQGHADMYGIPSGLQAMLIENPPGFFDLFDTHPLIESRIAVIRMLGGTSYVPRSIIPKTKRPCKMNQT